LKGPLIVMTLVGATLIVASLSMLLLPLQPPLQTAQQASSNANVTFVLYAGEPSSSTFAFGLKPNNLTSPGPTLTFSTHDTVNVTLVNVGKVSHAFALTNSPHTNSMTLFNAAIASASMPLNPGGRGTIVFKADTPGSYYYICPVPGHAELGMWGNVLVKP
jgi:uncharacterized cupredoxin-like copper-binding protein